ncbi:ABC transporter permease [Microbacterium sp. M3]|uniref:Transport permease protein n=1 Tax=Microbacterium arthrosphaerae TaxID=792652 RepID=A0ABU4H213_9MICO|nr:MULTISPECIES: ABC transporter permease [Microbacterium]MDW4573369.1 ABC transporter permease [Microbacterium arthrosphaerae]MDW7607224.1 ABC transporter permease [Microbacterium sp. M3]
MDTTDRFARIAGTPFTISDARGLKFPGRGGKVREIVTRRDLLGLLIRRDLQARYRDSVLGFLWTLIRPIVQFLMYYLVLGQFLRAAEGIDQFAIFLFAGLTIYGFFAEMVQGSTMSILGNAGLVKKIYLPREIFPLSSVGASGFMFFVQTLVLLAGAIIFQALPTPPEMLWIVPSVLLILVYGLALGILLSALNVYLRDVQYVTDVFMMLAMWGSPIVYSWTMVVDTFDSLGLPPWAIEVYTDNPITLAVLGFRKAFWGAGTDADYPDNLLLRIVVAGVIGLVLLVISHRVFTRLQGNFAQEM